MTVPLSRPLIRLASGRHLPHRTLRLRLTLLYGGLFLACGAVLLAITYVLVAHATVRPGYVRSVSRGFGVGLPHRHRSSSTPLRSGAGEAVLASVVRGVRISDLHQLVIWSAIALAVMSIASILLGWIVAGRALRPLRTITATTREISATNLHRRLALQGPHDDVKDLGDTIDALLARLEDSFQAQRAFVANASHELRTPLTLSRAMLQFALADPALTLDSLKATCADALNASAEHEQLLDALLTLAQSQQHIERHETFDLTPVARDVIEYHQRHAADHRVAIHAALGPAPVSGDPRLARTLLTNLLENALRYNVPHGRVDITLERQGQHTVLTVANTGPRVPADQIDRLLEPFRHLTRDRSNDSQGHGLGLSIVAAIATAHDATLTIQPRPDGGLHITIQFLAVPTDNDNAPPAFEPPPAKR